MSEALICKKCLIKYREEYDDENHGTKLCYFCFEDGVEQYEIDKRRKIAEANEY